MRDGAAGDEGSGDGASTNVPIAPRDASDGRVSGLVKLKLNSHISKNDARSVNELAAVGQGR